MKKTSTIIAACALTLASGCLPDGSDDADGVVVIEDGFEAIDVWNVDDVTERCGSTCGWVDGSDDFASTTIRPDSIETVIGHGQRFLMGSQSVLMLHGTYANQLRIDASEISMWGQDMEELGGCFRTLTIEIDTAQANSVGDIASVERLDDGTFAIETRGTGLASVSLNGRVTGVSVEEFEGRGRGRTGDWGTEEQMARCADFFDNGEDVEFSYSFDLDVREVDHVDVQAPEECTLREGTNLLAGSTTTLRYALRDAAGEDVSWAANWSNSLGVKVSEVGTGGSGLEVEPGWHSWTITSTAMRTFEPALYTLTTLGGDEALVRVISEAELEDYDLTFMSEMRGYVPAEPGSTFWSFNTGSDRPDLLVTLGGFAMQNDLPVCGSRMNVELESLTPDVCEVREYGEDVYIDHVGLGVFFSDSGTCELTSRAPGISGAPEKSYTFTLDDQSTSNTRGGRGR